MSARRRALVPAVVASGFVMAAALPPDARATGSGSVRVVVLDGQGQTVDPKTSHASLQRTPPDRLADDPSDPSADPDAVRFVFIGPPSALPGVVHLASRGVDGEGLDAVRDLPLVSGSCPLAVQPVEAGLACAETLPIRAVADDIDRLHPLVRQRSIKAELGGLIGVFDARRELAVLRVGGPRQSRLGRIERLRAHLRIFAVRLTPGGPSPTGLDDEGTREVVRSEAHRANSLWGACGISFGPPSELAIEIVDPPPPHLLSMGCEHGLDATGGRVSFMVEGRELTFTLEPGVSPRGAARTAQRALERAGFLATLSDNAAIGAGEAGSSDVLVRRRDGALAALSAPSAGPISTDATMTACIGSVDLRDGLQHFGDVDAISGTLEERTLIKAFDDGDPSTLEVFFVPSFAGGGRIGESFIFGDRGAIRNVVIEDRGGLRADRASFTLAHEIGHVLLDDPGHPDDYGVDTPTRLMDADAANSSAYGPRRLLVSECERALVQSGPTSPAPLLVPWPLSPLPEGAEFE